MKRPETDIYDVLAVVIGLSHHEIKHLAHQHMGGSGRWKDVLWRNYRVQKDVHSELIDTCTAHALAGANDPKVVGERILKWCWPTYPKGEPMHTYTVATRTASRVIELRGWGENERQRVWKVVRRLLRYEKRNAESLWDEKMLGTYLRIRELL